MWYGFCSKFHTLSSSAKNFGNQLRLDKVTESLKVGTFFEHTVYELCCNECSLSIGSVCMNLSDRIFIMKKIYYYQYVSHIQFVNLHRLRNALHSFEVVHTQFANY